MRGFDEVVERARSIVMEEGGRALEEAGRVARSWKIESAEVRRALMDFIKKWRDYTRPAIISLSCKAIGGRRENVASVAAPLILISGAFDLHDDIIDRSYIKGARGRRTILGRYGVNVTLLLGDALLIKGLWMLASALRELKIPEAEVEKVLDLIFELGNAEACELRFIGNLKVTPEAYLKVVEMKAADVEAYARVGALIGGGSDKQVDALGTFGRKLGAIAILRDDLEDLINYKVELKSRVKHESLPLPLYYTLKSKRHGKKLYDLLTKKELTLEELEMILKLAEKSGGIDRTLHILRKLTKGAEEALNQVEGDVEELRVLLWAAVPPLAS